VAENVAVLVKGESRSYCTSMRTSIRFDGQDSDLLSQQDVDFVDDPFAVWAPTEASRNPISERGAAVDSQISSVHQRVKVVGDAPGQASALKMGSFGLPKGLIGLFSETMLFAREMDCSTSHPPPPPPPPPPPLGYAGVLS